jgi:membrane-associated protease RseP (regulator of RpoE activity)
MKPTKQCNTQQNLLYVLGGLGGISLIILIHEMGHFLFAYLFNVPTPSFSLGFGPTLYAFSIGQTVFKIGLLPFGGYVEMNPTGFAQLSYFPKMLILFAGILFNLIFAYIILFYYAFCNKSTLKHTIIETLTPSPSAEQRESGTQETVIGPIGIITIIANNLAVNAQHYWLILAILSLNMGLFNILPLPFFDGGKALIITIETIIGTTIPATALWLISTIFLALFILFMTHVSINDIKQLFRKK